MSLLEKNPCFCGIGTDVGKTVVSTVLVKAFGAHYWKPIQSGHLDESDTQQIKRFVPEAVCYPEAYRLSHPLSPHHAAELDGIEINESDIQLPNSSSLLVIEATGEFLFLTVRIGCSSIFILNGTASGSWFHVIT